MFQLGEESGEIIQVLDSAEQTLSAVADVNLEPRGKITPVCYTALRKGDPETWDTYEIYFEDGFIIAPEGGIKDIAVDYTPAFLGDYTVEILVTDIFENESDILDFPVLVVDDIASLPRNPTLTITQTGANQPTITWPASDAVGFFLESNTALNANWTEFPNDQIAFDEATGTESITLSDLSEQRFFRLNKPQPTP